MGNTHIPITYISKVKRYLDNVLPLAKKTVLFY